MTAQAYQRVVEAARVAHPDGATSDVANASDGWRLVADDGAKPPKNLVAITVCRPERFPRSSQLQTFISQAFDALLPGGVLIVETADAETLLADARAALTDPAAARLASPTLLAYLAEATGFSRVTVVRLDKSPNWVVLAQKAADPEIFAALDEVFLGARGATVSFGVHPTARIAHSGAEFVPADLSPPPPPKGFVGWVRLQTELLARLGPAARFKALVLKIRAGVASGTVVVARRVIVRLVKPALPIAAKICRRPSIKRIVLPCLLRFPRLLDRLARHVPAAPPLIDQKVEPVADVNEAAPKPDPQVNMLSRREAEIYIRVKAKLAEEFGVSR